MKLIVGLGNKGSKYENTRHNVGFMFIDFFLKKNNLTCSYDKKFDADIVRSNFAGEECLIIKPQTFMNLSGRSVMMVCKFYNIKPEDVLVIYDDIDQDFNKVKTKKNGSHGGHNGIRNIIDQLKTNQIPRIKIGVGRHLHMPTEKWVLSRFTSTEITQLNTTFEKYESFIIDFIKFNFEKACNGK